MLKVLWNALVYRPIFNILICLLYIFNGSLWRAILILTLLIRWLLWNTTKQQSQMQKWMGDVQQKMKDLQDKYANDPEKLSQESMKLMKEGGMAPLKWCLGMLVQLPVFIWLMYVIRSFASGTISADSIYSFIVPFAWQFVDVKNIDHIFFWLDLFAKNSIPLTIVGAILIFFQTRLTMMFQQPAAKTPALSPTWQALPDMTKMMWPMNLFLVIMMWSFIYNTQNWVGIYLVTTTFVSVLQYVIQHRQQLKIKWATRGVDTSKKGKVIDAK